ncbi:MAG: alpha-ketoglutarate-dependent dioxygenase AlkB [Maribacter sp.]|nr:alpha-ketoglutarate-dependent dioxygenase AlkB [Maribacter sp.]
MFKQKIHLDLPDSNITYYPNLIDPKAATHYFNILKNAAPWQQDDIKVFGKIYPQPRLTAFYGNGSKSYSYSNITMHPRPFTDKLLEIKQKIEEIEYVEFNSCLLNLYRNGKDSNGWHADDEKELGQNPIIASISLGQERTFHLRHKKDTKLKHKITLEHGSLLLMKGSTQHYWQHQVPKTAKPILERINLTFRIIQ